MMITHPTLSGEFIIRTQPPIIVGQVVKGNIEELVKHHQPTAYEKAYEADWAVFYAGLLAEFDWQGTTQEQADYLAKIMRKMSDFYLHNILKK